MELSKYERRHLNRHTVNTRVQYHIFTPPLMPLQEMIEYIQIESKKMRVCDQHCEQCSAGVTGKSMKNMSS